MARPPKHWADASERSNESRSDVPSTYVLRLSRAACTDLGVAHPGREALIGSQHQLVRKFVDTFQDPAAIDRGVPFRQMPGKGLYRIRAQEWRGLVWTDTAAGVVWLCRGACLADYPQEDLLYDDLAGQGEAVFPTTADRDEASRAQALAHALRSLRDAMQRAHDLPFSWQEARMRGPGQHSTEGEMIGRAYVEQIEEEGESVDDRFLITIVQPPPSVSKENWISLVMRMVFPSQGGKVLFIGSDDLPAGTRFNPGPEVALAQAS